MLDRLLSRSRAARQAVVAIFAGLLVACASQPVDTRPLYQRLGGSSNMTVVVGRMIDRVASDPRTRRSFDGVKLSTAKKMVGLQICSIAGGGCKYEGETMANAHKGLKITEGEFDALLVILQEELDHAGTDSSASNDLLQLLQPMRRDIVKAEG
jgi:hemoglobin